MPARSNASFGLCAALCATLASCRPAAPAAAAPYPVAVQPAQAVSGAVIVPLEGRIPDATGPGAASQRRDYRLSVALPAGARASVHRGQAVWVRLPVVRHARAQARVEAVAPGRVDLLLPGQVQALDGRVLQVELPLEPAGLVRLPFEAACSPRGLGVEVYVVRQGRAEAVSVEPLALDDGMGLLVAGGVSPGEAVIWQGQDRLLAGDRVQALALEARP
jgi:hypothetical protein